MAWIVVIVLAPLVLALIGVYLVLKFAALLLRIAFAPVVWLNGTPTKQRIELRYYSADDERR
ncbi:MAG: hypothetical protein ACJ734_10950 [Gaiellaceae bacterium]